MKLGETDKQLLDLAAAFIETHSNGTDPTLRTLMVGAVRRAGGLDPAPLAPVVALATVTKQVPEVPDGNVDILLRAGGMKTVRAPMREVYALLLRHPAKSWTLGEMARRTGSNRGAVGQLMLKLVAMGAAKRLHRGEYQAS